MPPRALPGCCAIRDDPTDAEATLQAVYNRFTEGFDTADLNGARLFLEAAGTPSERDGCEAGANHAIACLDEGMISYPGYESPRAMDKLAVNMALPRAPVLGSGQRMKRRKLLAGTAAALAMPALAQTKPDKLVFVGDNGPWHWTLVEEVAPEFEKASGIKVDFTLLPGDALSARLKAELNSGTVGIDVIQVGSDIGRLAGAVHGGSRDTAGENRGTPPRLRLGRFSARRARHGELQG